MNRHDRLIGILIALQGGRKTASRLAERFEVSRRTILRDVEALSQIGVPIVALPGAGGGYALAEGFWLPPLTLTGEEASLLLLALKSLGEAGNSPFGPAHRSIQEKLRAALNPDVLSYAEREVSAIDVAAPHLPDRLAPIDALRTAIRSGRWLAVAYGSRHRVTDHVVRPLRLFVADGRWYCAAVSAGAKAERIYRVDRIARVQPTAAPADAEEIIAAAASPAIDYHDPGHPEVVVRLGYRALRDAEDHPDLGRHLKQVEPDCWEIRFRCPPDELPYYAREFFRLGAGAVAIGPPELRRLIKDHARLVLAAHRGGKS